MSLRRARLWIVLVVAILFPLLIVTDVPAGTGPALPFTTETPGVFSRESLRQIEEASCILSVKDGPLTVDCSHAPAAADLIIAADISSAGPLTHIYAGQDLSNQVAHVLDGTVYEFYPPRIIPGDSGTLLVIDGVLYGPAFDQHGGSATGYLGAVVPYTFVSQTAVQGSGSSDNPYKVITIADAGTTGVRVIQTDSYVIGSEAYRTDIQLSNSSNQPKDIVLFRAADCYLGSSDYGYGMVDVAVGSVACTKNPNNDPAGRILQYVPLSAGSRFYQAGFSEVWSWIGSKRPFPDTCRCTERIDNGMGLSWGMTLAAATQVERSHMTTFSPLGSLPLTMQKTADNAASPPGGSNGYTIRIDNPNAIAVSITQIIDTLPVGFTYVNGSTTGATTDNPTVQGRELQWNGPLPVPASGSLTMHFGVTASNTPGQYTNDARATASGYSVSPVLGAAPITVTIDVSPIALDFELDEDGYSFENFGPMFGDFTQADMVLMFGAEDTCAAASSSGSVCVLRPAAIRWHAIVRANLIFGHCDGMTNTALRFFTGLDQPSTFQTGAVNTFALDRDHAHRNISWYQALAHADSVIAQRFLVTPNQALQTIYQAMQQGSVQLVNLAFYSPSLESGHAVLPYAIEDMGNGQWRVSVYDNNSPNDSNRFFIFDTVSNTYSNNLIGQPGGWVGSASQLRINVTPLTVFLQRPECPWCDDTGRITSTVTSSSVLSNGISELLITDGDGRRLGYVNGQLVNEIPGAVVSPNIGGLGIDSEPTYLLPSSAEYSVAIKGENVREGQDNGLTFFGPGFAASVVDVQVSGNEIDKLSVQMDGSQISYEAGAPKEIHLALTGGSSDNEEYQISGADIGSGERVALRQNPGLQQVVIDYEGSDGGDYDLSLSRATNAGLSEFVHENIDIAAGESHVVLLETWEDNSVDVCLMEDGSNELVDCEPVVNEAQTVPEPPQDLDASDGELIAQVRLTWTQSEGATHYEIYRSEPGQDDWELFDTRDGQYDFTDDSQNDDGTVLAYALKACSDTGCSDFSNVDTGYADMPRLNDIQNPDMADSYVVSWQPAATASSHYLEERLDQGAWTPIYSGNATSIHRYGQADGTWCYRVRGYNGIQLYSPWTPETCTVVQGPTSQSAAVFLPVLLRQSSPLPSTSTPLTNGNFERGPDGSWTEYSTHGWDIILEQSTFPGDFVAHSGTWAAWLGGAYNEISLIEQDVTIPATAPYLTYWHWIASEDYCGYDFGGVLIDNSTVVDAYDLCTNTSTNGWVRHVVDLRSYAGQTVDIQIRSETDGSLNSNLFVDDVSFQSSSTVRSSAGNMPDWTPAITTKHNHLISSESPDLLVERLLSNGDRSHRQHPAKGGRR